MEEQKRDYNNVKIEADSVSFLLEQNTELRNKISHLERVL